MLNPRENELITRVGPGTPMGDLYRRFWLPVLVADELPEPDCVPVRLTVLGEKLVAFKDSNGRIGILDERCPHRLARCSGAATKRPACAASTTAGSSTSKASASTSPTPLRASRSKRRSRPSPPTRPSSAAAWSGATWARATSCRETPGFELNDVPATHRYISKMFIGGNWMQGMEGDIDSSHVSFLHSRVDNEAAVLLAAGRLQSQIFADKTPKWFIKDTDYGVMLAAQRQGEGETHYWRVNQWVMPSFTMIAARPGMPIHFQVRVPMDDERQIYYRIIWHPTRPLTEAELNDAKYDGRNFPEVGPGFKPVENVSNDYIIDRAAQRTGSYTGIKSVPAQDWAVQEYQGGPILDRSLERLVSADASIIAVRARILNAVRALQEGTEPVEAASGAQYRVRPIDIILDNKLEVWEGAAHYLQAEAW